MINTEYDKGLFMYFVKRVACVEHDLWVSFMSELIRSDVRVTVYCGASETNFYQHNLIRDHVL